MSSSYLDSENEEAPVRFKRSPSAPYQRRFSSAYASPAVESSVSSPASLSSNIFDDSQATLPITPLTPSSGRHALPKYESAPQLKPLRRRLDSPSAHIKPDVGSSRITRRRSPRMKSEPSIASGSPIPKRPAARRPGPLRKDLNERDIHCRSVSDPGFHGAKLRTGKAALQLQISRHEVDSCDDEDELNSSPTEVNRNERYRVHNFQQISPLAHSSYSLDNLSEGASENDEPTPENPADRSIALETLAFSPYRKKGLRSRLAVNNAIYKCLKASRKPNTFAGWMYVLESPDRAPGHVKIGSSKSIPPDRQEQWETKCRIPLRSANHIEENAFKHFVVVEDLCKAELGNHRRKFQCKRCRKSHIEWFELDAAKALLAVKTWREWIIIQKPFNSESRLTAYWQWRVDRLPEQLIDVDWAEWTQPSLLEQVTKGYGPLMRDHLRRKDVRFWFMGAILVVVSNILLGWKEAVFICLSLLAL